MNLILFYLIIFYFLLFLRILIVFLMRDRKWMDQDGKRMEELNVVEER